MFQGTIRIVIRDSRVCVQPQTLLIKVSNHLIRFHLSFGNPKTKEGNGNR